MLKVKLTTWERLLMRTMLLAQPQGNTFQEGNWGGDFIDILELNKAERAEIDFKSVDSGSQWDTEKDHPWDISLDASAWRFAFKRLLHPQALGWSYDKRRNEDMKTKMQAVVDEIGDL